LLRNNLNDKYTDESLNLLDPMEFQLNQHINHASNKQAGAYEIEKEILGTNVPEIIDDPENP